ncbi:transmembrane protein 238-like [Ahaetulla prasina]|uniref:transmembrane protein 238-like n=1 Tax=Ahaetulla prasina TaxID=499056 RepID=UPI0026485FDC|nr:transmembrane protein 238-like [Ahaetulla prasina]XP_058027849.1 transmembrane protein 238-like [Ahaetulla prasina]
MARNSYGRCAIFLAIALVMDVAGLVLLLVGGVGRPTVDGRPFKDFLMLTGGLLLFLSLLCWLFWYSGNLRGVPVEELPLGTAGRSPEPRRHPSFLRLAAKLSERLSQRRRLAPAPSLFSACGAPAKTPKPAASLHPDGPLELGRLRTGVPVNYGTKEERLV